MNGEVSLGEVISPERMPAGRRSLHELGRIEALCRAARPTLADGGGLEIVTGWLARPGAYGEVAGAVLGGLAREGQGSCALIRGPAGAGKTHLLIAVGAVCLCTQIRTDLLTQWGLADVARALAGRKFQVIATDLADFHATDSLEEIFFGQAERKLAAEGRELALTEDSYLLRAVSPAAGELERAARQRGFGSWQELVDADRAAAVRVARAVAAEKGIGVESLPSRAERLSMLREACGEDTALVWLVDGLDEFLQAAGPKAARVDVGFLEFLAHWSRVAPVHIVAAARAAGAIPELGGIFEQVHALSSADAAGVALRKARAVDDERMAALAVEIVQRYRSAWPDSELDAVTVAASYPFHPAALEALLQAGEAQGRGPAAVGEFLAGRWAELRGRPAWRLVGLLEVGEWLCGLRDAPVATRLRELVEAGQAALSAEGPEGRLCVLAAALLHLAGWPITPTALSEGLGLGEDGRPILPPAKAAEVVAQLQATGYLEAAGDGGLRLSWAAVDRRSAQQDFQKLVQAVSANHPRVAHIAAELVAEQADISADEWQLVEIEWLNSQRVLAVRLADLRTLTAAELEELARRLASPDEPETAAVIVAAPVAVEDQRARFGELIKQIEGVPGAEGICTWLPASLPAPAVDALRTLVAAEEVAAGPAAEAVREVAEEQAGVARATAARLVAGAYFEGSRADIAGAGGVRGLDKLRDRWGEGLQAIARPALQRRHPNFARIAPKLPIADRRPVDMLEERLIFPGSAPAEDRELRRWAEAVMAPMGLVRAGEERLTLVGRSSPVVQAILDMLRQRDTSPAHEMGRAVECAELARVLFKSEWGLMAEQTELALAAMVRLGYLVALDGQRQPLSASQLRPPFAASVHFVARAPLLGPGDWRTLGRLLRALGHSGALIPDHETQQQAWDFLVAARQRWLERIADMRERLGRLWDELGQGPEQWQMTLEDLDAGERLFKLIDPDMQGPLGLRQLASALSDLLDSEDKWAGLGRLLRRLELLDDFLGDFLEEVVAAYRYLTDERLRLPPGTEVEARHSQFLEYIASGERMLEDPMAFRRLQQMFFVTYARRYISWHNRCFRRELYEAFKSIPSLPEFRALELLSRLEVDVQPRAEHVRAAIRRALEGFCSGEGLEQALRVSPVCPHCELPLGEEPDIPDIEEVRALINAGLRAFGQALSAPEFREKLRDYLAGLPRWGDLTHRLLQIANLAGPLSPQFVLSVFNEEVVAHLNRMLSGKPLATRSLEELRRLLRGRTLTREEAARLIQQWLDGGEGEEEEFLRFDE